MILNWNVTKQEAELIVKIVERAERLAGRVVPFTRRDAVMDLTAAHANGAPLDLEGLLAAKDGDFTHDVWGIMNHLNRETGKLTEGGIFNPRYRRAS